MNYELDSTSNISKQIYDFFFKLIKYRINRDAHKLICISILIIYKKKT